MLTLTTRLAALCGAFAFCAIVAACGQQQGATEKAGQTESGAYQSTEPGVTSPTEGPLPGAAEPTTPAPGATPSEPMGKESTAPTKEPSQPKQP